MFFWYPWLCQENSGLKEAIVIFFEDVFVNFFHRKVYRGVPFLEGGLTNTSLVGISCVSSLGLWYSISICYFDDRFCFALGCLRSAPSIVTGRESTQVTRHFDMKRKLVWSFCPGCLARECMTRDFVSASGQGTKCQWLARECRCTQKSSGTTSEFERAIWERRKRVDYIKNESQSLCPLPNVILLKKKITKPWTLDQSNPSI